jgi:hypothetical protein
MPYPRNPARQKAELIQKYFIRGYLIDRYSACFTPAVPLFHSGQSANTTCLMYGFKGIGKRRKKRAVAAEFASTKT